MGLARILTVLAMLCGAFALVLPGAASAQVRADPPCHAYSDGPMPVQQALTTLRWNCADNGWEDGHRATWLRFEVPNFHPPVLHFTSRSTVFDAITIAAVDANGSVKERVYSADQARAIPAGPAFRVDLPPPDPTTIYYVVRIDAPHSVTVASEARLSSFPARQRAAVAATILLALAAGMLVMPLLFDAMFYLVLRERFVVLHAGMTVGMIVYIFTSGGVITAFFDMSVNLLARIAPLTWALGVGFGGMFIANFVERDMLRALERKAIYAISTWSMLVPGFCALQLDWTQAFDNRLYFYAFMPVIPALAGAILVTLLRGSRAAKFLALAWTPVLLAAVDRLLKGMGVYAADDSLDLFLYFALAFEVMIVGLGVADRFFAVRRERDRAVTEAKTLEELTERDALTGLLNRRAIEARFTALRAEGFTTMAVIDLDHFKSVNDRYGHTAGDLVLKSVATALRADDDNALAFRMGGEEFVLLLRGKGAIPRADARREAITGCVSSLGIIPDRLTASMGVVEAPLDALTDASFDALYRRADRLLYEAKASGRDRTMSERLKVFRPRRQAERRAAA